MGKLKRRSKSEEERLIKVAETAKMFAFFLSVWDERSDKDGNCFCYETGVRLWRGRYRENFACYHHVLHKETYPQYKYCKENIVIIEQNIHTQVHTNMEKTPKVYELTKTLKQKHNDETLCSQE